MAEPAPQLVRAWLDSLKSGIVEFDRDWTGPEGPAVALSGGGPPVVEVRPAPLSTVGEVYGYYVAEPGTIVFVLFPRSGSGVDPERDQLYVAGDFNGWQQAVRDPAWLMHPAELEGRRVLRWTGPSKSILGDGPKRFKFVTGENIWLSPPDDEPNVAKDSGGVINRVADLARTGRHLWRFTLAGALDLAGSWSVSAGPGAPGHAAGGGPPRPLVPGGFFFDLGTDLALGAIPNAGSTLFRLFAPRARSVTLLVCATLAARETPLSYPLVRRPDEDGAAGVWEIELEPNLEGWFYWYAVDGSREAGFDPAARVLDPYALATVDRDGPGIVVDRRKLPAPAPFTPPAWQDLVVAEAHVRDLTALAPIDLNPVERRGFSGLRKWVESPSFYLHHLGVNCVELQPVQEFDNRTPEEYHWGYMTNNYFAPESSYSLDPAGASGIAELRELVAAFHRRGMAVLLDVVYNHVGEPPHLRLIDALYYFEQDSAGRPANWSGCGNDVRAGAAMAKRLIIDSLIHLIEAFGVDGFRFDLSELLGLDVLREIEAALKRIRPNVILIAEPWSFRGHIAGALRDTGFSSWNDGYRDTVRDYVRGRVPAARLEYFLRGSPWYFAKWPAQTVNYVESHDDRTVLDAITENDGQNGFVPAARDVERARLLAALLFMSIGIPMLSAGQDFLRSKRGVNNTYQRGDLNALDYRRLERYLGTHAYYADWIAFRLGERGRLLRQFSRPSEGFFRFWKTGDAPSFAVMYNDDFSQGPDRLLFAINPTLEDVEIEVGTRVAEGGPWRLLADHERFVAAGSRAATRPVKTKIWLPGLGCALWAARARSPASASSSASAPMASEA